MILKRFFAGLAVLTLVLAACGDDDDGGGASAEGSVYAQALVDQFNNSEDAPPFSDQQVSCLAGEMVAAVGGDSAFEAAGVTPEELSEQEELNFTDLGLEVDASAQAELAGIFSSCDVELVDLMLESIAEGDDTMTDEVIECLRGVFDEETLATAFAVGFAEGDAAAEAEMGESLMSGFMECALAGG